MADGDFILEKEKGGNGNSMGAERMQGACIGTYLPPDVIARLMRPSFRKRHPLFFWGGIIAILVILCSCFALISETDGVPAGDSLALVKINGVISQTDQELKWIAKLEQKDNIKGVLVRVDSPGGGAGASEELYEALSKLAQKKPVVVSMGSMAASGGLMVSMAGTRIFAGGSTVTGSIGVRMDIPQVKALLDKIGVGRETLTTAPYKDAGSPLRPLNEHERRYLDGVLKDMHGQFVDIVAKGRHMEREKAEKLANGQVYTGREALARGLVDELGTINDAHAWLAKETGVPTKEALVSMPAKDSWLQRQVKTMLGLDIGAFVQEGARAVFLFQY